ncbi:hypothetical protein HYDPIDRAFT_117532 [Hydnomerulius pinastri MD-312]|uniref:Uncharacterized protein n=1 Tax=Hydnomerulius pinastri MD-312 TaxID=994086 RepID=A0A0C9VR55_9AGAM|nr:hypothetical protein HYDPIDRAFT_117532 [Hydnomerulius pinastri MD-312]
MATFEYVDIPTDAIRLQSSLQDTQSHSIRAARKIFTSLPDSQISTPATAPSPWRVQLDAITISPYIRIHSICHSIHLNHSLCYLQSNLYSQPENPST